MTTHGTGQYHPSRIGAFIGGVGIHPGITPIHIGGIETHAHVLVGIPTTLAASQAAAGTSFKAELPKQNFEDEYRSLLNKHAVEFGEQNLFD